MKMPMQAAVICLVVVLCGCHRNQTLGRVDVDLYIHPESASSDDILLQTAIRRELEADEQTRQRVHVRVVAMQVVLTGNVPKDAASKRAMEIALATQVQINKHPVLQANEQHLKNLIVVGNQ